MTRRPSWWTGGNTARRWHYGRHQWGPARNRGAFGKPTQYRRCTLTNLDGSACEAEQTRRARRVGEDEAPPWQDKPLSWWQR